MMTETYTPGFSDNARAFMARRSALSDAAFLLPHLTPGMVLLDCGCGPGSISVGLAAHVDKVVAMDQESSQLEIAQKLFHEMDMGNLFTRRGSVYEIPAENHSFDVVF